MRPRLEVEDTLVVKVGTASIVDGSGRPDEGRMDRLCRTLAGVHVRGLKVVLVTSGAIAAGLEPMGLTARPTDIPSLQAAAALGQPLLVDAYSKRLSVAGVTTAQVLLTRHDFMHRQQYVNARNTFDRLLSLRVLPIVNENDTVATDEIRFGDNDLLAALVANLTRAKLLVLLTDARGVHAADPRKDPDAVVLDEVDRVTPELERAVGGTGSGLASGGMRSKIAAAWVATFSGVGVEIAPAEDERVLERVVAGERAGTYFHPRERRASARRLWIAFGRPIRGLIAVDPGAKRALVHDKRSLLSVGVVDVRGSFSAGDTVDVADMAGYVFGRGLVRWSSEDLRAEDRAGENAPHRRVAIHRDDLVVLEEGRP
jgi:glutamate 5-kinase